MSCNKSDLLEVDANDYTQAPPSEGDQVSMNTDFQSGLGYKIVPLPPVTSSPPCRGTFYVNAQLPIIADATNPCSNISSMETDPLFRRQGSCGGGTGGRKKNSSTPFIPQLAAPDSSKQGSPVWTKQRIRFPVLCILVAQLKLNAQQFTPLDRTATFTNLLR